MIAKPVSEGFRFYPEDGLRLDRLTRLFFMFVWRITLIGGLGYASYLFTSRYIIQTVQVQGISMFPTLHNADRLFLHRWFYNFYRDPRPHDIVVIKDPSDQGYAIKRVIAGPGDFVFLDHGLIYVNGRQLDEPYLPSRTWTFPEGSPSMQWMIGCPDNEYIVLGDNRGDSLDSRCYGAVPRRNILGIVFQ
jgi:signal peptidase I